MNYKKLYVEQLEQRKQDIQEIGNLRLMLLDASFAMKGLLEENNPQFPSFNKLRAKNEITKIQAMFDAIKP